MTATTQQTANGTSEASGPPRCALCGTPQCVKSAGFHQVFRQAAAEAVRFDWWECTHCGGWFVEPVPTPEVIDRFWESAAFTQPDCTDSVAAGKAKLFSNILQGLGEPAGTRNLLDVGCNFGTFLERARSAGWTGYGFEPNPDASATARRLGFEVVTGWEVAQAEYRSAQFQAITVIDTFYYSWYPLRDLQTYHRLLSPGGVLAMRLSNRQSLLKCIRAVTPRGPKRDERLSGALHTQFHSITPGALKRILLDNGFSHVEVSPPAAAQLSTTSLAGRLVYRTSDAVYWLTLGRLSVSPAYLIFARKAG